MRARFVIGAYVGVSGDTIHMRVKDEWESARLSAPVYQFIPVPLDTVETAAVSRHRHARTLTGALVGLFLGASIGFASGDDPPNQILGVTAGTKAAVLGVVGVGLGALVGSGFHSETWETVPLEVFRVAPVSLHRTGVGVVVRF